MAAKGPDLTSAVFSVFSSKEVRELSVVELKTPLCFNALGHPLKDGPYDLVMGPSGFLVDPCGTCKQSVRNCPGHFGHIELPLPVVNPLFHKALFTVLRMSCMACSRILIPGHAKELFIHQMRLLDSGLVVEAEDLDERVATITRNAKATKTPEEVLTELVRTEIVECLKALDFTVVKSKSSKIVEALRQKFTRDTLRGFAKVKTCPYCRAVFKKITSHQNKLLVPVLKIAEKYNESVKTEPDWPQKGRTETKLIIPDESRAMLRNIWEKEKEIVEALFPFLKNSTLDHPTDLFFQEAILVPPPKLRPVNYVNGQMLENSQTRAYKAILGHSVILQNIIKAVQDDGYDALSPEYQKIVAAVVGKSPIEKLHGTWLELQYHVNHLLDADMNRISMKNDATVAGLKQVIEKKEGILRMHMMGKRVNFAARTVITPDPNLRVDEIGIPEYFAKRLSFPCQVTYFNVEELRRMVQNGPDVYPGATMVENENGSFIKLLGGDENRTKRDGVAKLLLKSIESDRIGGKIVHRHLVNGDMLLLNRQPTLHRPSIMAHKAKILKSEKTLRMHYSNCKAYNADFDGDEMNVHCPQNEIARSEAANIVNVANHYLVPKDGTPLGGLIQDHVISGVRLTTRGQFFEKQDYQQLVFQALSHYPGDVKLLPPSIVKPKHLWSGKQIISTILINIIPEGKDRISLNSSAKIGFKSWERESPRDWKCGTKFRDPKEMSEAEVIIRNGELLCGVLDKQHYGATPYGLTHCLYELYGGVCSSKLLDSLGKLFTSFLQVRGFTIGVEDILVLRKPDKKRRQIIKKAKTVGDLAAAKSLDLEVPPEDLRERLEEAYFKDGKKFRARLDQEYKKALDDYTNSVNKVCLPSGLLSKFPDNNLQLMVTSGAKGSTVNTMQISCMLGQIELEGKRPPWMISGRSLPSFKAFETSPRSGGYIDGRFMTGINPQDFFFHCMAGREGLIDTAVKTSRSGYLQRCLIKHLEGVTVSYDNTVRDHDGSVIQFAYGEDGMDVGKAKFFTDSQMEFLYDNRHSIVDAKVLSVLKESENLDEIERYKKELGAWRIANAYKKRRNTFTRFSECVQETIKDKYNQEISKSTGRSTAYRKIMKKWNRIDEETRESYKCPPCPDPVTSVFRANRDFGVVTEKIENLISDYLATRFQKDHTKKEMKSITKSVRNMMNIKYMTSLCDAGDAVGLLAAQSVGEPSTQMTLNTFHFAGRGEMNVTLGIPRLREILMTASRAIKTPNMDIPMLKNLPKIEKRAQELKRTFRRVTIADALERITVDEKLNISPHRMFTYKVRFHFLPRKAYKSEFVVKPKEILSHMERKFLLLLSSEVRKLGRMLGDIIHTSKEEKEAMAAEEDRDDPEAEVKEEGITEGKKGAEDAHESSDEEGELDDDDATKAKLRNRHEEQEYDEETEGESEKEEELEKDEEKVTEGNEEEEKDEAINVKMELDEKDMAAVEKRRNVVLRTFGLVKDYHYDVEKEEWCEFLIGVPVTLSKMDFSTVLREICEKSVLYQIPNIRRAIVYKSQSGEPIIKTEGINIVEMFKYNHLLDVDRLYSNDIHQMAETYGIEAAVRIIVKELQNVFGVYGITVDPRHLLLIADYMTHEGEFLPLNRMGMSDSPSPLQQMSFESSIAFLRNALLQGKTDDLMSPSSRIMIGRCCYSGTGCFELMRDLNLHS